MAHPNHYRLRPCHKGSTEFSECDLRVVDSIFRLVSVELQQDGELWVWLPLSLDYPNLGGFIHAVTLATFGKTGLE